MYDNLLQIYSTLERYGIEKPFLETLQIMDILLGGKIKALTLTSAGGEDLDLEDLAKKRKEGMPREYILGQASFMGLSFYCSPATLIPREETELLVNVALDYIDGFNRDEIVVIDMGTGCGNIAVSIAINSDNTKILATDLDPDAIDIAKKNVKRYELQKRVSLFCGDRFSPFEKSGKEETIDLIVCNPPYIPSSSVLKLSPEILDFEPKLALDAGPYGIDFFSSLISGSLKYLKSKGILVFEIGEGQEKLVTRLFRKSGGYEGIQYFYDHYHVRVISGMKI